MSTDTQTASAAQKSVLAGSLLPEPEAAPQALRPAIQSTAKRTRERLVLVSMALVTAAASAVLFALFDFSISSAVLTGGLIWAALMSLHIQFKKNAEIAHLRTELARHDAARTSVASEAADASLRAPTSPQNSKPRSQSTRRPAITQAVVAEPTVGTAVPPEAASTGLAPPATVQGPKSHPRWEQGASPKQSAADPRMPSAPQPIETALWPGTALSVADPMRDQWAFRPRAPHDLPAPQPHPKLVAPDAAAAAQSPASAAGGAQSIDVDLETVQRKIKALVDEVNAAEMLRDRQLPQSAPQTPATAAAIEKSIGALRATAETMRDRPQQLPQPPTGTAQATAPLHPLRSPGPAKQASASLAAREPASADADLPFDLMIPATAERIAVSDPGHNSTETVEPKSSSPQASIAALRDASALDLELHLPQLPVLEFAPPPPNPRLAAIIAAVESGAMDVFLSPIVALQTHQVSHYDVTVRLKSASGSYLDGAEQELQLAGSDMLALFDIARLKRSAALAQRLDAHNKPGSLLSAVNGPSITNGEFLETFALVYEQRDRISNQLVLTFTQADVEQFTPSAWQALSDMNAFGFRFALSKIDHVSMDFASLAERGFAFLRLDADALLKGLPARDRFMGADELCRHLAGAGMTLVADTIDDEAVRARIFGFGILFGQGRLFGGARQVKLDGVPAGSSAAA